MDRIAEIRARLEAATPGPWEAVKWEDYDHMNGYVETWDVEGPDHDGDGNGQQDAEFIAHARDDVPFLLAEIERLSTALAERDAFWVSRLQADDAVEAIAAEFASGYPIHNWDRKRAKTALTAAAQTAR